MLRLPSEAGQLTFLCDAFVGFLRAFDVIFEFSADVRQPPGDFVWPRGCMGDAHGSGREPYDLPYFELIHPDYRFLSPRRGSSLAARGGADEISDFAPPL